MSEMIMRIAAALSEADHSADGDYRKLAVAALEAMREPTEAMLEAGPPDPYMDRDVWAKMIDQALEV
jgi:hypothetical protein